MTTDKMRNYLIEIIKRDGVCDDNHHFFTEEEVRNMSSYGVKRLYDLCYPNFGELEVHFATDDASYWDF